MIEDKYLDSIEKMDLFRGIARADLKAMLAQAVVREYGPRSFLFSEGMTGDVMYVILEGQVELTKRGVDAPDKVLATLEPGQFVGEMSLIENQTRSATAKVNVPTKALVITRLAFRTMLDVCPKATSQLLMKFLKVLSGRLRRVTSQTASSKS